MSWTATDRRRVTDAQYRKRYNYKRHLGVPTSLIPADDTQAHVARLVDLGWSCSALAHMTSGVTDTTVVNIYRGHHPMIERDTAAAVMRIPYTLAPGPDVPDEALIPTLGAERRVHALMRGHWNHAAMRKIAGDTTHLARGTYGQMLARRWRAVDAMFRDLCMTVGPSPTTARRAEAAGMIPALAWSNIDDPDETPTDWRYESTDRREALRDLADMGLGITEAARRLHLSRDAVWTWCKNHGMSDVYRKLAAREALRENQHTRGAVA